MAQQINRRTFLGTAAASSLAAGAMWGGAMQAAEASRTVVVGVMGMSRGRSLAATFAKQPGDRKSTRLNSSHRT